MFLTVFFDKVSSPLAKITIKIGLLITMLIVFIGTVIFSNILVTHIVKQENSIMQTYMDIYRYYLTKNNYEDMLFFLESVTPAVKFPIIITDAEDEPIQDYDAFSLNTEVSNYKTIEKKREYLLKLIQKMHANYEPILVFDDDGNINSKFYYTHSNLVEDLKIFPIISALSISIIIGIGYFAFTSARNNEQSKVWVGMARETAHQLGTPLSSLLAWIELLRFNKTQPELIEETANEIEKDINRLNIIATRFSKIGSLPDKKNIDLRTIIEDVSNYYEKRLPHNIGRVIINKIYNGRTEIVANNILMGWVFENLIKNAAEAMEGAGGIIEISTIELSPKKILILVKDTGKGMTKKMRMQIFEPGFTTKKRGWGIGLNLVKRIVEEYHSGKIYIKDSSPRKGTIFAIELPFE